MKENHQFSWLNTMWQSFANRSGRLVPWKKPVHTLDLAAKPARWSVNIRLVDGGSSNAAELEVAALFNPVYDLERFGFRLVASPRQADLLLVTGPLVFHMCPALLEAFHAMPMPRKLVTIGDGFRPDGLFSGSYAVVPLPEEMHTAWVAHILGDPPSPMAIATVLLSLNLTTST
jgi:Ni,Fe-hydrogenase III small subunit